MAGDMLVMSKSQMEQLAVIFARQKETAEGVISAISAGIDGTTWQGARADRFRQLWESEFRAQPAGALRRAGGALRVHHRRTAGRRQRLSTRSERQRRRPGSPH